MHRSDIVMAEFVLVSKLLVEREEVRTMDESLTLIEAKIARLRKLLHSAHQSPSMMVHSPLHHEIDKLVAQHARISLHRYLDQANDRSVP